MSEKPVDFTMNTLMHKAFKRELDRIRVAVGQLADGDDVNEAGLVRRWRFFSVQLEHHHEGEDKFIWPLVRERAKQPSEVVIIDAMESEHAALHKQLDLLNGEFDALSRGDDVDYKKVGRELDDLRVIVAGHCDHEEIQGVQIADKYVKSDDLGEFHKFTRSGEDSNLVFPWICDGAPESDQKAAWGVLPGFVRIIAKPIMTRKYRAFVTELN